MPQTLDIPRFLTAVEAETAAFVRALLPALDEVPGPGSGAGPRFHALALEFVIAHGGADLEHAGELHVHVAGSRSELREVHVEQWALSRFEARAGTPCAQRLHAGGAGVDGRAEHGPDRADVPAAAPTAAPAAAPEADPGAGAVTRPRPRQGRASRTASSQPVPKRSSGSR